MRRQPARRLATVLFTDVVGSTAIAAELGDERWRRLLARHHAIVRRELARFGGREIDTAGDGFLAAFEQPAEALRCAWAIADAVREIGLEIRAAVHTGEVEALDGRVGGIAVHIGARIMSLAAPREILASATVRDLTAGAGFEFEDRGSHELKGVPGVWHVAAVVRLSGARPAEPLEERAAEDARTRASEAPVGRPWRRVALVAAAIAALVGVSLGLLLPRTNDEEEPRDGAGAPPGGVLVEIDPETRSVIRSVPLHAPVPLDRPAEIAVGEGGIWAIRTSSPAGAPGESVAHLDPATGGLEVTIPTGDEPALHTRRVVVGGRTVWVVGVYDLAGDTVVGQINPATDEVVELVQLDAGGPTGIAAAEGDAWVVTVDGEVARVDGDTMDVIASRSLGTTLSGVTVGGGALWVIDSFENAVMKVDPGTLRVEAEIEVPLSPGDIAFGDGRVWVLQALGANLVSIDAETGSVAEPVAVGREPSDVAVAFGAVWVADPGSRSLFRLDPLTGATDEISLEMAPSSLAPEVDRERVWVWGR